MEGKGGREKGEEVGKWKGGREGVSGQRSRAYRHVTGRLGEQESCFVLCGRTQLIRYKPGTSKDKASAVIQSLLLGVHSSLTMFNFNFSFYPVPLTMLGKYLGLGMVEPTEEHQALYPRWAFGVPPEGLSACRWAGTGRGRCSRLAWGRH